MFPEQEIKNILLLATQINPQEIRSFLRCLGVRDHPEMRQIILEHYADNNDESTLLQMFVNERIEYTPGNCTFVPYGIRKRIPGSLCFAFEKWKQRQDEELLKFTKHIQLKQTLLSFIHMNYPGWENVEDRRRVVYVEGVSQGKMLGITNITCRYHPENANANAKALMSPKEESFGFLVEPFRKSPWWIETFPGIDDVSENANAEEAPERSSDMSSENANAPEPEAALKNLKKPLEPMDTFTEPSTFEEFLQCAIDQVSNSTLDLSNAQRIRSQLLDCRTDSYYQGELSTENHNIVLLTNIYGENLYKVTALRNMFTNNNTIALDTEFSLAENNNPNDCQLCYIQISGAQEENSPVFIIGPAYFHLF
uniref:Uncharacterized protein n=1 Tax=Halimeda micronesica TaxID=170426 RepID=A0A386AXB5_9CHLO|nr:hypothetical protein [Halimeda micronesica]